MPVTEGPVMACHTALPSCDCQFAPSYCCLAWTSWLPYRPWSPESHYRLCETWYRSQSVRGSCGDGPRSYCCLGEGLIDDRSAFRLPHLLSHNQPFHSFPRFRKRFGRSTCLLRRNSATFFPRKS